MSKVAEVQKKLRTKTKNKKIPHLNMENGKVIIDSNDPKQVNWFEEFKK